VVRFSPRSFFRAAIRRRIGEEEPDHTASAKSRTQRLRDSLDGATPKGRLDGLLTTVAVASIALGVIAAFPESWWEAQRYVDPARTEFAADLVLVGLDESYAERVGYRVPTRLSLLADLVDSVAALKPKTLVLDVLIEGDRMDTTGFAAYERALARADADSIRIVLPIRTGGYGANRAAGSDLRVVAAPSGTLDSLAIEGYVDYEVVYRATSGLSGVADAVLGPPAVLDFPLAARLTDGTVRLSLPLAAAAVHEDSLGRDLGQGRVPHSTAVQILESFERDPIGLGEVMAPLHYEGVAAPSRIRYVSAADLAGPDTVTPKDPLTGALVLIAAVYPAPDGADTAETPYGRVRGGIVHLYAIDTLLRRVYPVRWSPWTGVIVAILFGIGVFVAWRRSRRLGAAVTAVLMVSTVVIGLWAAITRQVFVPMAWPVWGVLAGAGAGFVAGRRPRSPEHTVKTAPESVPEPTILPPEVSVSEAAPVDSPAP